MSNHPSDWPAYPLTKVTGLFQSVTHFCVYICQVINLCQPGTVNHVYQLIQRKSYSFVNNYYRHLLWIPRTILDQNFDLKSQCAYYMRTKYPGFFFPHPANVLIASYDDKHTGYIDSMFSCFGKNLKTGSIILILISSTVCLKY